MLDALGTNEIQAAKKTGLCYRFRRPHLQCECKSKSNNKFQNKLATQHTQKCNNKTNNHMFPTGTSLFQASQPVTPGKDVSLSMDDIKHLLSRLWEKYSLQKEQETQHGSTSSLEGSVNEVVQAVDDMRE